MRNIEVQRILRDYMDRFPDVRDAYENDPYARASAKLVVHVLGLADLAMQNEGVPLDSRIKVVQAGLGGAVSPADTEIRLALNQRMTELIRRSPIQGLTDEGFYGPPTKES